MRAPVRNLTNAVWRPAAVYTLQAADFVARACRVWAHPHTALTDGWYPGLHAADIILVSAALPAGVAAVAVGSPGRRVRRGCS